MTPGALNDWLGNKFASLQHHIPCDDHSSWIWTNEPDVSISLSCTIPYPGHRRYRCCIGKVWPMSLSCRCCIGIVWPMSLSCCIQRSAFGTPHPTLFLKQKHELNNAAEGSRPPASLRRHYTVQNTPTHSSPTRAQESNLVMLTCNPDLNYCIVHEWWLSYSAGRSYPNATRPSWRYPVAGRSWLNSPQDIVYFQDQNEGGSRDGEH